MIKKAIAVMIIGAVAMTGGNAAFAYDVKKDDTLWKIANKHDLPLTELITLNPQVKNINLINIGDYINTTKAPTPSPIVTKEVRGFTTAEMDLFARVVSAEARSESYKGKVAVAEVILNRIDSKDFPNTLNGVIYQKQQFSVIADGAVKQAPTKDSFTAIREAANSTDDITKGALFFYNPAIATSRWLDSKPVKVVIGGHHFK